MPVLAALVFRTYDYGVASAQMEMFRQIDIPFILFEIFVIAIAARERFTFTAVFTAIDRPARLALAAFLATFWIGSIISNLPAYSMMRAIYSFIHIAFALSLASLLKPGAIERTRTLLFWLTAGLAAWIPILLLHVSLRPTGMVIWESAMPGYLSVRLLGMHAAIVAALGLGEIWRLRGITRHDLWLLGANVLALVVLFWSGTRAGILGYAVAALALLAIKRPAWSIAVIVMALFGLSVALSAQLWIPTPSFGFAIVREGGAATVDAVSSARLEMWAKSVQFFLASPFFGHGEGAALWLLNPDGSGIHKQPHNALVQMAMSWGLVGTVPALYLLGRASLSVVRQAIAVDASLGNFAMLVALVIMSMLDGIIWHSRTIEFVALGFGLAFAGTIPRLQRLSPSPLPPGSSAHAR